MHAKAEHRCGKKAGDIDPERIHPARRADDFPILVGRGLLAFAQFLARNPAGHFRIAAGRPHREFTVAVFRHTAEYGIVHVAEHLLPDIGLMVMRVDIDDHEIVVTALRRLTGGVLQERAGVEFVRRVMARRLHEIHDDAPSVSGSSTVR